MAYHPVYQQNSHIKKDTDSPNSNNQDVQELTNKMANLFTPRMEDADNFKDFSVSKSDPKYQTLPYNTKFTVNLLPNRIIKNENFISNVNSNESKENEISHITNNNINGNMNIQSTHMTVHSAPLSAINKNIATPLNQHDILSRKTSEHKDQTTIMSNGNHFEDNSQKPTENITYLSQSNSTSTTVAYQVIEYNTYV